MAKVMVGLAAAFFLLALDGCFRSGLGARGPAGGSSGPSLSSAEDGHGGTTSAGGANAPSGSGGAAAVASTGGTGDGGFDARMDVLPTGDVGPDGPMDRAPASEQAYDCFIAVRTDVCCGQPFVISRNEMDYDDCVQPYQNPVILPECVAKRPRSCAILGDCAPFQPPTRIVGRGPGGGSCQFLSECETVDDCIQVVDVRECCGCPHAYPRAMVESDPCLQPPENRSPTSCPGWRCASVKCDAYCPLESLACTSTPGQADAGLKACTALP